MPFFQSDNLDTDPTYDGSDSFVGGQASAYRANIIPMNAAALLTNVDTYKAGEAITRRGSSRVGSGTAGAETGPIQGMTQHKFTDTGVRETVVSNNGKLYRFTGGAWSANIGTAWPVQTGTRKVEFATGQDALYFVNGANN